MKEYIEKRVLKLAHYIILTGETVRSTGQEFGISKSTVHTDVTVRLKKLDYDLYLRVARVLDVNFRERHVRGGESTRLKYLRRSSPLGGSEFKS